ncbi:Putative flavin amine oxidase, YjgF/YER057c/UK114 family, RutC-like superfamily [Septoria linicola]|uniref:Amine oxidase n=1 Tax=Septoria linicola TaxID=215465 RepID=A0A9Q9ELJ0_9PEZI|nr:Putative flavin amine oxidase, YjgF/YER057c/UK114 family, RutC-like superfamily [Septoria linicola]
MTTKMRPIDVGNSAKAYYAAATSSNATEIIHVAGQPGTNAQGKVPADFESQIQLALLNLRKVLLAADAQVPDILKLTFYIVDYSPAKRLHTRHIRKFLDGHRPAVTLVPVPSLAGEGWLFEIEAVVAKQTPEQLVRQPVLASAQAVDVVIIGAGLAGLTAAAQIITSGLSCVVLEARDRVGGRTWSTSVSTNDGIVDLGAAWINDTNQSRMIGLARKFNLELVEQNTSGNAVLQDAAGQLKHFAYGELPPFEQSVQDNVAFIRDQAEADCQLLDRAFPADSDLDSITFAAYLRRNGATEDALKTATVWTRAMLGHDPEDVSALFFLSYCKSGGGLLQMRSDRKGGGQHLRLRYGTQQFAERLVTELPDGVVQLSSAVSSVDQLAQQDVVVKRSGARVYRARKVVSAVPPPVLKKIHFEPPLPLAKQLLIDSFRYGFYQKVIVVFKTPFWIKKKSSCGLVQSFLGPAAVIRDTSVPVDDKWVLTCFVAGTPGQEWSRHDQPERERQILEQIAAVYEYPAAKHELVEFVTLPWSDEEWTGYGCPSPALPPGVLEVAGHAIRDSVRDVHFVGTETSDVWKGYMEGAVRSGERGAEEVIDGLTRVVAKL